MSVSAAWNITEHSTQPIHGLRRACSTRLADYFPVAEDWAAELRRTPKAEVLPFPGSAAFSSPLATSLRLPLTKADSVAIACDAAEAAAVLWLSWMQVCRQRSCRMRQWLL